MRKTALTLITVLILTTSVSAASYSGDGSYKIEVGDTLTTDNSYTLEVDSITTADQYVDREKGSVSVVFDGTYTTTVDEGKERSFTSSLRSSKTVARMEVIDVDQDDPQAEVSILSGGDDEEETPQSPPENSSESKNQTFNGSGTYNFTVGDRVKTERGYKVLLKNIVHDEMISVNLLSEDGETIALHDYRDHTFLSKGSSRRQLEEYGITAIPREIDPDSGYVKMSVSTELELKLNEGWNLISFPLSSKDSNSVEISENSCQKSVSDMTFWTVGNSGDYVQESPKPGKAYWTKSNEKCSLKIRGETFSIANKELTDGWNMIGSPTKPIDFSSLSSNCKVESGPWGWSPVSIGQKYLQSGQLKPGNGYFVKIDGTCTIGAESPPSLPE